MLAEPQLDLTAVSKRYGKREVLRAMDATFPRGLTLLRGVSGSGKSTLLKLCATAERPTSGGLHWKGEPLRGRLKAIRSTLGYAPQRLDFPEELTGVEFLRHMTALKQLPAKGAAEQAGGLLQALGLGADGPRRIAAYSGGMRRRLILAQALLGAPRLLVLDEPTSELDHQTAERVQDLILERAKTAVVIMTTHLAGELDACGVRQLQVEGGRLVGGAPP